MNDFNQNSKEAGNTPTDGSTSGFPSPAADYLAVKIDFNKVLINNLQVLKFRALCACYKRGIFYLILTYYRL